MTIAQHWINTFYAEEDDGFFDFAGTFNDSIVRLTGDGNVELCPLYEQPCAHFLYTQYIHTYIYTYLLTYIQMYIYIDYITYITYLHALHALDALHALHALHV